jgi:ferritin-like metal-binding protein YciE
MERNTEKLKAEFENLKEETKKHMADLKETWSNLPDNWNQKDLHVRCQGARFIWNLIENAEALAQTINKEAARDQAIKMIKAGFSYDAIEIDGFKFTNDGCWPEADDDEANMPF